MLCSASFGLCIGLMRREFIQVENHWYRAFALIIPLSSFCTTYSVHNSPLQLMTLVQALSPMSCRQKLISPLTFSHTTFLQTQNLLTAPYQLKDIRTVHRPKQPN